MSARRASKSGRSARASGVSTTAGRIALQRMPSPPYSTASARVRLSSAPLAAAYGAIPGTGLVASVEATLTIARSPLRPQQLGQRGVR